MHENMKQMAREKAKCHRTTAPVFVIGVPRSGTTVISEAISVHEDLGWLSNYMSRLPGLPVLAVFSRVIDIPLIGQKLRGKKKQNAGLFPSIRRFLPFSAEAYPVWNRYCRADFAFDYLKDTNAGNDEKKRVSALVDKVLRFQGKKRFFAKFTGPPRIHYLNSIFPDAYFIHVIRAPRANLSSLLKVSFWKQNQGFTVPWWKNGLSEEAIDEWERFNKSPVALGAIQWKEIIETAWKEKGILNGNRYIEVHYEDFVANPVRVLNDVFDKISLGKSANVSLYIESIGKVHDMNYKYKLYLANDEIEIIDKITGISAKKAGY